MLDCPTSSPQKMTMLGLVAGYACASAGPSATEAASAARARTVQLLQNRQRVIIVLL